MAEVVYNGTNTLTTFSKIKTGEGFIYEGEAFIKSFAEGKLNCGVNLASGQSVCFAEKCIVTPVELKVIVKPCYSE